MTTPHTTTKTAFQFRLRTLLLVFIFVGFYFTLCRIIWHWMLLLTITALPVAVSLFLVSKWTQLPGERRTFFRGTLLTVLAFAVWMTWADLVILGPGEAMYKTSVFILSDWIPGSREFLKAWSGVWR